jgi:hypothetical protein
MATADERMKVLQMLEEGKVSAEEAAALLRALAGKQAPVSQRAERVWDEGRLFRVQVTDLHSGKAKVNVTLPTKLIGMGLRIAERFAPEEMEGIDVQELEAMLASGAVGKILEVEDEDDGERVEIYVE